MNMDSVRGGTDWVGRARDLAPAIAAASDQTEKGRQVTDELMAKLHEAAMFRAVLPCSLGGGEADPLTLLHVLETVAAADASTAWCMGQAFGCSLSAAFISEEAAEHVFGPPNSVLAWGPINMKAKAVATDGGYRVTGNWMYASGSRHATWMGAHIPVYEADGNPRKSAGGVQEVRTMLFPKDSVEMIDVWQVIGLKGTGSDNYAVTDLFVPDAYTFRRDSDDDRREAAPVYKIPLIPFYGIGFAGVALGIARAMMDSFIELSQHRVPSGSTVTMRENASIQTGVGEAEAKLGAAKAYLTQMTTELWDATTSGTPFTLHQRARLRTAITYGSNLAREVADYAYRTAGAIAVFESQPFERRYRDIHAVSQQGQSHLSNLEAAGQVFLGLQPAGHRI